MASENDDWEIRNGVRKMNIDQFQVFRTIAESESFTRAAKILNFTQPAVSSQVKILEQTFNTILCERSNNGVTLTDAGKIFYDYGDKILALHSKLEDEISRVTGEEKEFINIGASNSAGNYSLPCTLLSFKEMHPNVRFKLDIMSTADILQGIRERQLDIGVVEGNITDLADFNVHKIDWDMQVVCRANESLTGLKDSFIKFITLPSSRSSKKTNNLAAVS